MNFTKKKKKWNAKREKTAVQQQIFVVDLENAFLFFLQDIPYIFSHKNKHAKQKNTITKSI
jgi:hypothetical protein